MFTDSPQYNANKPEPMINSASHPHSHTRANTWKSLTKSLFVERYINQEARISKAVCYWPIQSNSILVSPILTRKFHHARILLKTSELRTDHCLLKIYLESTLIANIIAFRSHLIEPRNSSSNRETYICLSSTPTRQ